MWLSVVNMERKGLGMKRWAWLAIAVGLFVGAGTSEAQSFPEKPISLVVAFAAGGSVDTMTRALAGPVGTILGQPVVVENRTGAGGAVATTALKTARPDGYALVSVTSTTLTFDPQVSKLQFGLEDFTTIAAIGEFQEAYVAVPARGWKSFQDLIEAAKKGPLTYGSSTQMDRVVTSFVAKQAGVQLTPVPSRGGADVMTAVLGGHVNFGYSAGIHYSHVAAGNMVVLASLGDKRLRAFPQAPTLRELGYDVASINYSIILAPKGLPQPVHARLADAFARAAKDQAFTSLVGDRLNLGPLYLGPAELEQALRAHAATYKHMLAAAPAQ